MKKFLLCALCLLFLGAGRASADGFTLPPSAVAESLITINATSGAGPSLNSTSTFDGVGRLSITKPTGSFICSGSLLLSGKHVLTAAHCADSMLSATITFLGAAGSSQTLTVTSASIAPGYTGAVLDPRDVAILTLASVAGPSWDRYDIYRNTDEAGQISDLVGYGRGGSGGDGTTDYVSPSSGPTPFPAGTRRQANNYVDGYWDAGYGGLYQLAYDFDNYGTPSAFDPGLCYGFLPQAGVAGEGLIAPGDSGGPLFLTGLIAGVHSFGFTEGPTCGDTETGWAQTGPGVFAPTYLDSSWGEFAGDARVSNFSSWIDGITGVPEPSTFLLVGGGLLGLWSRVRRSTSRSRLS